MSAISPIKVFSFFLLVLVGSLSPLVAYAEPSETIINNGSSDNRVDIVVMGDGYTVAEMQKYRTDVQQFMQAFFAQEPYREYQVYFNVIRVDVVSNQSGADHPEDGTFVDTALDAAYNCSSIERLICINVTKAFAVINRSVTPAQSDIRLVIVNDQEYGGSGGVFAVGSVNSLAVEVILHEVGHSFGFLGDEYGGNTCGTSEPSQPNLTRVTTRSNIKWNYWIDPSTPIPTFGGANGVPGLYEGGGQCDSGFYRPTFNSKMRSNNRPFEQINTEQLIKRMYNFVSPFDTSSPSSSSFTVQRGQTQSFSVIKLIPLTHSLDVTWFVDGQVHASTDTFLLDTATLSVGGHTVDVLVKDNTTAVRRDVQELLTETRRWDLTIEAGPTPTPTPTPTPDPPSIVTETSSNRAIALNLVTMVRDPFPLETLLNFSSDHRTRIVVFAHNAQLSPSESSSIVTAQFELGPQVVPVQVEYVGPLIGATGLTMVVIILPDSVVGPMDALLSITVRGVPSNKVLVAIKPP